jgi:hypothetical protein
LAQGFLDYPANDLRATPDTLRIVYDNALVVLYRMLFILYSEARELLPLQESADYRESYSLHAIKHDVEENLRSGRLLQPTRATLWPKLMDLFNMIDEGDQHLKVPSFNGGLFDPQLHPFLQYAVSDAHLQQAIDKLARVGGQFVDYRDLAERELGTIYEGVLEFHLEVLAEPEDGFDLLPKSWPSYYESPTRPAGQQEDFR